MYPTNVTLATYSVCEYCYHSHYYLKCPVARPSRHMTTLGMGITVYHSSIGKLSGPILLCIFKTRMTY